MLTTSKKMLSMFLILATAMLVAAGCGGEVDNDEYAAELEAAIGNLEDEFAQMEPSEAEAAFTDLADELEDIEPPSDVEEAHEELIDTFRNLGESIGEINAMSEDPANLDQERMQELSAEVQELFAALEGLEQEFADAGIELDNSEEGGGDSMEDESMDEDHGGDDAMMEDDTMESDEG